MRRQDDRQPVELDLRLERESDKAWLVKNSHGVEAWLPKSQVDFPHTARRGETVTVDVPAWLVEQKELA